MALALALTLGVATGEVRAQAPQDAVDEHVAATLYDRGMVLFEQGDIANAKKMFSESLARSPKGARSADALRMLRASNEKLGIDDLDAGSPEGDAPLDPYGEGEASEGPLDPYGEGAEDEGPLDPYGEGGEATPPAGTDEAEYSPASRRALLTAGALHGLIAGMAILGPFEDTDGDGSGDELSGGAFLTGILGGVGGAYLAHYAGEKLPLEGPDAAAVASGNLWGMYNFVHLGNVFTGADTDGNDAFVSMALGGLAGTGLGYWYAKAAEPTEGDISFVNSMSIYGTGAGLFLAVALDPPRGDAYSLNATLGSLAGLGTGLYFAGDAATTRSRMLMVDLGAAGGAALPWITIYPLTGSEQTSGFFSAIGFFAGAYAAWLYTEDDEDDDQEGAAASADRPAPALIQRDASGALHVGAPVLQPMHLPELSETRGTSLGASLFSGRF